MRGRCRVGVVGILGEITGPMSIPPTAHFNLCPNLLPECTFWEDESCFILCAQAPLHKSSMARRRGLVRGLLDGVAFQSLRGHLQLGRRIGPGYAAPLIYVQTRRCGPACMCIHEYQCAPLGTPVCPPPLEDPQHLCFREADSDSQTIMSG